MWFSRVCRPQQRLLTTRYFSNATAMDIKLQQNNRVLHRLDLALESAQAEKKRNFDQVGVVSVFQKISSYDSILDHRCCS